MKRKEMQLNDDSMSCVLPCVVFLLPALGAYTLSQVTEFGGEDLYKEYKAPGGVAAASVQSEDDDNQSEDVGSVASNAAEVCAASQLPMVIIISSFRHPLCCFCSSTSIISAHTFSCFEFTSFWRVPIFTYSFVSFSFFVSSLTPHLLHLLLLPLSLQTLARHVEANEMMRQDLVTLHGCLEFVRTGLTDALPEPMKKEWMKTAGKGRAG